jgi:hypothetical protein
LKQARNKPFINPNELIYCKLSRLFSLLPFADLFKIFRLSGEKVGKNVASMDYLPIFAVHLKFITYGNNQIQTIGKDRQKHLKTRNPDAFQARRN